MTDVVGSAGVTIEPDASNFGSDLQAALGPAIQAAISSALSGGGAIADALQAGLQSVDFSQVGTEAQAGFAGAETAAATAGADIEEALTNAAQLAGQAFEGIPVEVDTAMSAAEADVTTASQDISAALENSVGPAVARTTAAGRDEMGRFASDADTSSAAARDAISNNVQQAGLTIKDIALGNIIADGIETGVGIAIGALGSLAAVLPSLGSEFHGAFSTIRIDTGATGAEADNLKQSFENLANTRPEGLDQIGTAIGIVNQRLGDTGQPLEDVSRGILRLSSLTGTDLNSNLQSITGAFNIFGVSADQQAGKLDELLRVFQATGVPIDTLTSSMSSLGPLTKQLGLSFEDTASLIGGLNKAGLDAGSIQMGLSKIMKRAADDHVSASTELTKVFEGIKSGVIDQAAAIDMFGPRGARLFDLIKSGTLDYKGLSAAIAAGGDTLSQAATDTMSWQAQLSILGNQLKVVLEPIATAVFTAMTTAVAAVRPVIVDVAQAIYNYLTPGFQAIAVALMPVWDLFSRAREGVVGFVTALQEGGDVFDGIVAFFNDLTGDQTTGQHVADALSSIADGFSQVWDALAPVRDAISSTFGAIASAVQGFLAAHPDIAFGALAGVLGGVVLAAVVGLTGAMIALGAAVWGVISPVLIAAAPFIAIGAAIGILVAAFIDAYNNIQPFHDAVDSVVSFIRDTALQVFDALQQLWNDLWPSLVSGAQAVAKVWNDSIAPALTGLWESLQPLIQWAIDHWQILAAVLVGFAGGPVTAIVGGLTLLYVKSEAFRNIISTILDVLRPVIAAFIDIAGHVIGDVINAVSGLIDILTGLFSWDWDKVRDGIVKVASAILDILGNIGSHLLDALEASAPVIGQFFLNILTSIPQWLGDLGAILTDWIENAFVGLGHLLVNIPQWLGDLGAIMIDWVENGFAGLGTLLTNVPQWLGDLGAILVDWAENAWSFVSEHWTDILKGFLLGLVAVPGLIILGLGKLGELLLGWLGDAWTYVSGNWQSILGAFTAGLLAVPGLILAGLGDLGSLLVGWLQAAWDFVSTNWPTILQAFVQGLLTIPGLIFQAIVGLGGLIVGWLSDAWNYVSQHWQDILSAFVAGLTAIPSMIVNGLESLGGLLVGWLSSAWDWVIQNGPGILAAIGGWIASLPQHFIDLLQSLGALEVSWLTSAWDWVVQNGPGILSAISGWFTSLPGKFVDLMFDIGSRFVSMLTSAWQWVVDNGPGILGTVLDWFKGLPGSFVSAIGDVTRTLWNVGGDIISGLWNGLKSTFGSILDGLGALAKPVVDAFKAAFGIQSPSTLMMPIGEQIAAGIGVGIQNAWQSNVSSPLNALAEFTQQRLDGVMETVKPFADGSFLVKTAAGIDKAASDLRGQALAALASGGGFSPGGASIRMPSQADVLGIARSGLSAGPPQAGAPSGLAPGLYGGNGNLAVHVTVAATPDTTAEHARMVGQAVGDAAGAAAQQHLAVKAAIYGS